MKKSTFLYTLTYLIINTTYSQFSIHAELRARGEYRDGARILLDDTRDPTFVASQRTRLLMGYRQDRFEIQITFQNARIWGEEAERQDVGNINLAEGWVKYYLNENKDKFAIKIGRQHLVLDDGRVFGVRNWNDIAVSHDLAVLEYDNNNWLIKTGAGYNNGTNDFQRSSYNLNNHYKYLAFLWVNRKVNDYVELSLLNAVDGNEDPNTYEETYPRFTSGVYVKGGKENDDFNIESSFYYQYGENPVGLKQRAYMYSIIPSYKITDNWNAKIGINYFSGNDQLDTGGANKAFNKLFHIDPKVLNQVI